MEHLVFSLLCSALVTLFIITFSGVHIHISGDQDLTGVQKCHAVPVPRIGGIGVYVGLVFSISLLNWINQSHFEFALLLLLPVSLVFAIGLLEDLTKRVSVLSRLLVTMFGALISCLLLDATLKTFDHPLLDSLFAINLFALVFTVISVAGVANAVNLIDGFNGLSAVVSITALAAIALVAYMVGDQLIMTLALGATGAVAGFLLWNYPKAQIFLGDGGAYMVGFTIAELCVLLNERNAQVSVLFPLLLMIYPVYETLFTIYRRKFVRGRSPGHPDAIHLHQLINKRLVRWRVPADGSTVRSRGNAMTSPYLWALNFLAAVPAVLFWDNPLVLFSFIVVFLVSYTWLYARLVQFKTPRFLLGCAAWLPAALVTMNDETTDLVA